MCAVIIFISFLAHRASLSAKLLIIGAAVLLFAVAVTVSRKSERHRIGAILICLMAIGAFLAASVQFLFVDMRAERARSFEGEQYCEILVIGEKESSSLHAYDARVRDIDGERVSFKASVYLSFEGKLETGDVVRARASIVEAGATGGFYADGADLDIFIYNADECALISEDNFTLEGFFHSLRERTSEYLEECFGEECGALARGVFLGDTDGISGELIRDFRRAGVSHLLAVSGLHISMLMAMAELLMRSLCIGRRVRCVMLAALSLVFLGMTGFAMSACRSVFMLLFVYLHYLFSKESDSLSALFVAVGVIMLISPNAAMDVGLWLSFLATLGIISVYSPVSKYLRAPRRHGFWRTVLRILKYIAASILLCFVCNVFTSIVVWLVFGEVSVVTLLSNLILTPIALLFLICIPIGMILAKFGILGDAIVYLMRALTRLMTHICGEFSSARGALISLGYGFAGVIIALMTASVALMLCIKMKRKAIILIPPIAAVAAFAVCLGVYNGIHADSLAIAYRRENSNEMIVMSERSSAAVIDISSGAYPFVNSARGIVKENYATEIGDFVLTHYHTSQPDTFEVLMDRIMIRRIHLPVPQSDADVLVAREIVEVSEHHGCEVSFYERGDTLTLLSDTRVRVDTNGDGAVAFFIANNEEAFAYIGNSISESEGAERFSELAEYIIFGVHGGTSSADRTHEKQDFILH